MKLSIVIPVYNEQETVEAVVRQVLRAGLEQVGEGLAVEVLVVDDASTDGTRDVLESLVEEGAIRLLAHPENRGKGAALRSGFARATGDLVAIQDADLEYDPVEIPRLLGPILDDHADVVYGSRFVGGQAHRVLFFWHFIGNRFLTLLSNAFTNLNLTDMETCYKVFRRPVLERIVIEEDRFGFEPEITAKVAALGARVYEVGISYHGRTYAEGKKIGWKDGVRAIWCIVKYGLRRRPPTGRVSP